MVVEIHIHRYIRTYNLPMAVAKTASRNVAFKVAAYDEGGYYGGSR